MDFTCCLYAVLASVSGKQKIFKQLLTASDEQLNVY
jgi:hypothetical protein